MNKIIPKYKFNNSQKLALELTSISAIYEKSKSKIYVPHRQDFFGLFYFTNSKGIHYVDFKEYKIGKGDVYLISNEQVHYFKNIERTTGHVILFTSSFLDNDFLINEVFETSVINPKLSLKTKQIEYFDILIKQIKTILISDKKMKSAILKNYLEIILLEIYQSNQEEYLVHNINYQRFIKFKKDLKEHFKLNKKVKFYADLQNISPKTLNLTTRNIIDKSAKQFINEYIILLAKRMLINSNYSSSEIAYELGFDEPTNFAKFFKNIEFLSPSKFKKNNIQS